MNDCVFVDGNIVKRFIKFEVNLAGPSVKVSGFAFSGEKQMAFSMLVEDV